MEQIRLGIRPDKLSMERAKKAAHIIRNKYCDVEVVYVPVPVRARNRAFASSDDMFPEQQEQKRWMEAYDIALRQGKIDAAVLDGAEVQYESLQDTGMDVAAMLKRGDPRYVLITNKKHKNKKITSQNESFCVMVNKSVCQNQIIHLFDHVECIKVPFNDENLIDQVMTGKCDAAVVLADHIKLLHLEHERDICYNYMNPENMVPETGRAIVYLLADRNQKMFSMLQDISSTKSEKEVQLERKVLALTQRKHAVGIGHLCMLASINRENLNIYVDLGVRNHTFRMKEHGNYTEGYALTNKIIEKITNIVDY